MKYMEIRKEERKDWTRAGQNRGTSQDLKAVSEALSYLRQKGLSTVEDLEAFLESSGKSAADYRSQMKPKEARSKVIDGLLSARTDCKECKPVYEKYQKIFFKKTKETFKQEHSVLYFVSAFMLLRATMWRASRSIIFLSSGEEEWYKSNSPLLPV